MVSIVVPYRFWLDYSFGLKAICVQGFSNHARHVISLDFGVIQCSTMQVIIRSPLSLLTCCKRCNGHKDTGLALCIRGA